MKKYTVQIYQRLEQSLYKDWLALWQASPYANYINSPQWLQATTRTYVELEACIIALYANAKLVGIVGLHKTKLYGIPVYTFSPADFASGDPILTCENDRAEVYANIFTEVCKIGTTIINNYPDLSVAMLSKYNYPLSVIPQTKNYILPVVRDESGKIILHNRKKLIHEAKKYFARYAMRVWPGSNREALEIAFSIDEKSRKNDAHYNAFAEAKTRAFYTNLADEYQDHVLISLLSFDGIPVAYEIGFRVNDTYTGSQIAYDREYQQYTPGKASEAIVIDEIAKLGVTTIDYGSGDSHIKRLICTDYQHLSRLICGGNYFSRIYLTTLMRTRDVLYEGVNKHKNIYRIYRQLRGR